MEHKIDIRRLICGVLIGIWALGLLFLPSGSNDWISNAIAVYQTIWGIIFAFTAVYYISTAFHQISSRIVDVIIVVIIVIFWIYSYFTTKDFPAIVNNLENTIHDAAYTFMPILPSIFIILGFPYTWTKLYKNSLVAHKASFIKNNENNVKNSNVSNELIKYKKLLDENVISQEEFESLKKNLLDTLNK